MTINLIPGCEGISRRTLSTPINEACMYYSMSLAFPGRQSLSEREIVNFQLFDARNRGKVIRGYSHLRVELVYGSTNAWLPRSFQILLIHSVIAQFFVIEFDR